MTTSFYTEEPSHKEVLTQRSLLHRAAFSQRHREVFTQRSFYTEKLLHTKNLNTEELLHAKKLSQTETFTRRGHFTHRTFTQKTFTQRSFYPQKLLHTETFTQRNFYTETFTHRSFLHTEVLFTKNLYNPSHRGTFTQRNLYTQTCLHTVAFTRRSFCTEKSSPIFHHVSFFMIIHHLSSSYFPFHALLVNSLRLLVSFRTVFCPSTLRPRSLCGEAN